MRPSPDSSRAEPPQEAPLVGSLGMQMLLEGRLPPIPLTSFRDSLPQTACSSGQEWRRPVIRVREASLDHSTSHTSGLRLSNLSDGSRSRWSWWGWAGHSRSPLKSQGANNLFPLNLPGTQVPSFALPSFSAPFRRALGDTE